MPAPWREGGPEDKQLRLKIHFDAGLDDNDLRLVIKDVKFGAFSLPNAWVNYMKGKNVIAEFFAENILVQRFVEGIKEFEITPDGIRLIPGE